MLMRITETGREYSVTLKAWEYGQYSPDVFADMETSVPQNYEMQADAYEMSKAEFDEVVSYWESECEDFNAGRWSEQFGDREDVGHEREMQLFVTELQ